MNLSTEAKVGGITLIGLILLAYSIVHLGGVTVGDRGYAIKAVFNQVDGLREGNIVRYAGVEVGRVKAVRVIPEGVEVVLNIRPGVKIPVDARFCLGSDGLMGEKYVEIIPPPPGGSPDFLAPGAEVRGVTPPGLDHLIATADRVLGDIQKLVKSLNEVLGDEEIKASLKDTILNAREITAHLNALSITLARMAADNEGNVDEMAANLRDMSASLRDVAYRVDNMLVNIDNNGQTAADLRETIMNIKTTSARVEKMAASLEGVVTDPDTGRNIRETLRNAREASEKANKMLTRVQSITTQTGFDFMYNPDNDRYQANADFRVNTSDRDFAVIGFSNIGEGTRNNFQVGRGSDQLAGRIGVVEGKAGIGLDGKLSDQLRLSLDFYDPNDLRVKLRTQYRLAPDTYLIGQTDSLNHQPEKSTFIGLRRTF